MADGSKCRLTEKDDLGIFILFAFGIQKRLLRRCLFAFKDSNLIDFFGLRVPISCHVKREQALFKCAPLTVSMYLYVNEILNWWLSQ